MAVAVRSADAAAGTVELQPVAAAPDRVARATARWRDANRGGQVSPGAMAVPSSRL